MGKGYLIVDTTAGEEAMPVAGALIVVSDELNNILYKVETNEDGISPKMELSAPNKSYSLHPDNVRPYSRYNLSINANGFTPVSITGVRIFDTCETIQNFHMLPLPMNIRRDTTMVEITNPEHGLRNPALVLSRFIGEPPALPRVLPNVIIPDYITVHLGRPESNAQNMRISFRDYIKNVASNEIYDTWPTAALEANIFCIISFTLNRIYTEFYRARGYNFDITNSTTIDHFFNPGGAFGGNISRVVNEIFNNYLARIGHKEPFLAQYCDGNRVKCPGWLSQWGSCYDGLNGMTSSEIIKKYYAYDLEFKESNLFSGPIESYPGTPLREGSMGEHVRTVQTQLNRIGGNFPIPHIEAVNGVFNKSTTDAVKKFQQEFNLTSDGIVGKATWYKISQIYTAVKSLSEMNSEGERIGVGHRPPTSIIRQGARGNDVVLLQFLLNYISKYFNMVPNVIENGLFDDKTRLSVIAFQEVNGLLNDGVVGPKTWQLLYDVYWGIIGHIPQPPTPEPPSPSIPAYPGYLLKVGSEGANVTMVQKALNRLGEVFPQIPKIPVDGRFGPLTRDAVIAFQRLFNLSPDGIVGPATWEVVMREYAAHPPGGIPHYPGSIIRLGHTGANVQLIQRYLNRISDRYENIPKVAVDGIFGNNTHLGVIAFQKEFGLNEDGIVGPATWAKLMEVYYPVGAMGVGPQGNNGGVGRNLLLALLLGSLK